MTEYYDVRAVLDRAAERRRVHDKAVAESRIRVDRQVEEARRGAVERGEISEAVADVERRNQRRNGPSPAPGPLEPR